MMDITLWIELILFIVLMGFSGFFFQFGNRPVLPEKHATGTNAD